jgi:hypothetical protein
MKDIRHLGLKISDFDKREKKTYQVLRYSWDLVHPIFKKQTEKSLVVFYHWPEVGMMERYLFPPEDCVVVVGEVFFNEK